MPLSADQLTRYKRHILLPEIGGQGQQKLLKARIIVIGAGGLGCPILQYLVAAGIGQIDLYDDDVVELSNLQRQILFTTDDIGKPKATIAAQKLSALNPDTTINTFLKRVNTPTDIDDLASANLLIEGVDNFSTRFLLNKACLEARTPFLSAAIGRFDGQLCLFTAFEKDQPCYQCFVPEIPPDAADCETQGMLGAVPGIIGAMAASEALKLVTGFIPSRAGSMVLLDGHTNNTRVVKLRKDPACPTCGRIV